MNVSYNDSGPWVLRLSMTSVMLVLYLDNRYGRTTIYWGENGKISFCGLTRLDGVFISQTAMDFAP